MATEGEPSPDKRAVLSQKDQSGEPEWAAGLKQLYDSVVEEELPESFRNLLAELDQPSDNRNAEPDAGSAQ